MAPLRAYTVGAAPLHGQLRKLDRSDARRLVLRPRQVLRSKRAGYRDHAKQHLPSRLALRHGRVACMRNQRDEDSSCGSARGQDSYRFGVARNTAVREPIPFRASRPAMNVSWLESLRPSSQKLRWLTIPPSSLSPVEITRSLVASGPAKMPVLEKSSGLAANATFPLLFSDGGLKPKNPNGPFVSTTVV